MSPAMSSSASSGKSIGPYEIVRPLGRGGMAEVYLGRLRGADGFEREVAIKRVLPVYASDDAFLEMFRREAALTSQLRHGNIVQVLEFRQVEEEYILVLEYVDGMSLAALLDAIHTRGETLAPELTAFVMCEVARALDYAHRKQSPDGAPRGVIHRDVSPSNVLVSFEGAVKLSDFGIAAAMARTTVSGPEGLKGKIGYMAPERLDDGVVDGRSDIYSLGVMGWEMLVGELPHGGPNLEARLYNIMATAAPRVTTRAPATPPVLADVIDCMLERAPSLRPARALQIADALAPLLGAAARPPEEMLGELVTHVGAHTPSGLAPTQVQRHRAPKEGAASAVAAPGARRVILLESSKTVRALVRAAVGMRREVAVVDTGEAALEAVAEGDVAMVVSQQLLPGTMSGAELCRALRARGSEVAFVLMVSELTPETQAFASDVGVSAVVTKADPEALVSTIRSVLGGRGSEVG